MTSLRSFGKSVARRTSRALTPEPLTPPESPASEVFPPSDDDDEAEAEAEAEALRAEVGRLTVALSAAEARRRRGNLSTATPRRAACSSCDVERRRRRDTSTRVE